MRKRDGQGLVEVLVGSVVLIGLAWMGLDVAALVMANSANDGLAKSAARAAANQSDSSAAQQAAQKCVSHFNTSAIITKVSLDGSITYVPKKEVIVKTAMEVRPPVAFPGLEKITFYARAVEPVVGSPADL